MPYTLGIDLGKSDRSALAIIQHAADGGGPAPAVVHLERFPKGTPYPRVVDKVAEYARTPRLFSPTVVPDAGGVGEAVVDDLIAKGVRGVLGIRSTSGKLERRLGEHLVAVPKTRLVFGLLRALRGGELKIAKGLPLAGTLMEELESFRRQLTEGGNVTFEHRTKGGHADVAIACMLAWWYVDRVYEANGRCYARLLRTVLLRS